MATAKKTHPYAIYYKDENYLTYDLTADDYAVILKVMTNPSHTIAELSVGIFNLADVRSVIKLKPVKKPKPVIAAHPNLTTEDIEWLALHKEAWSQTEDEEEGGMPQ